MELAVHDILKIYFERKRLTFPQYSLRALARDLKVSPAYASSILSGKRDLPEKRLEDFIKNLELDDIAVLQLKNIISPPEKKLPPYSNKQLKDDDLDFFKKYKPLDKNKYEILNNWYNIAILDLTTTNDFQNNPKWIAKRLNISQLEVEFAIENLKRLGMLSEKDGVLYKEENKLRFPTKMSQTVIRKFHKQMIKKAYEELDLKISEEEFSKRLISGSTFTVKKEKFQLLKEKLHQVIYEMTTIATEDSGEDVYQLNVQFFPLSK